MEESKHTSAVDVASIDPRMDLEGEEEKEPVIVFDDLTFRFSPKDPYVLFNINFALKPGSRCLLVGDNGAGKSSMLRLMAGKHIHEEKKVRVFGKSSFYDTGLNDKRVLLSTDWGRRTVAFSGYALPLQTDIAVKDMMKDAQAANPERRDMLVKMLQIDETWRMHRLSDGQRRRVQIMLQLLHPAPLIMLDEITTDLDCLTRATFLNFLKKETSERGATVIYATHIFGGLDEWWTHIAYIYKGRLTKFAPIEEVKMFQDLRAKGDPGPLLTTIENWIRSDRAADPALSPFAVN